MKYYLANNGQQEGPFTPEESLREASPRRRSYGVKA